MWTLKKQKQMNKETNKKKKHTHKHRTIDYKRGQE